MNFSMRTLLGVTPFLILACGGEGSGGQGAPLGQGGNVGAGGSGTVCGPNCFETCLGQGKDATTCSNDCSAAACGSTGGATSTGGSNSGNGGTVNTGNGGTVNTGNGGTASTGGYPGTTGGTAGTGGDPGTSGGATSTGGTVSTGGAPGVVTQSYTFTMGSFTLQPGQEVYKCQDFANPFGKDIDALVSESFMTSGSHHMFMFRMAGLTDGPVVDCPAAGSEFHEFVHTAQSPQQITTYPPGIGRFLPANQGIRMMVHYLNPNATPLTPTVSVRLDYVDPSQVTAHAAGIFLNWIGLSVPPGTSTVTHAFTMPYDINILGGASHMHKRGVGFKATTSTGAIVYEIPNPTPGAWDEPPANSFTPALPVSGNTNITVNCNYQNTTNTTFSFGDSADTDEMCIYAGSYYPAPNGTSIIQQCVFGSFCPATL